PNDDYTAPEEGPDGKWEIDDVDLVDSWRVLEKYYNEGVFKAIGVSNFSARQLQYVYDNAEVKPMNLQVELHILFPQFKLVEFCNKLGVTVTSFSTLGNPGRKATGFTYIEGDCLNHPLTLELSEKYNKTPAQILLRHVIQRGIAVIPKSLNPQRIRENLDVFDFEISQDDQKRLMNIGVNTRLHVMDFVAHHPEYPFKEEF
uniref:Aldo_ket_red domain-containing protein n=3 Tax=Bursaphelenchus xylophilus TaxID=6326 RepID=A0A1I7SHU7_BURXY